MPDDWRTSPIVDELGWEWKVVETYRGNFKVSSPRTNTQPTIDCYGGFSMHPVASDIFVQGQRAKAPRNYIKGAYCETCLGGCGDHQRGRLYDCICRCECGGKFGGNVAGFGMGPVDVTVSCLECGEVKARG
jgi:hypothetical protein